MKALWQRLAPRERRIVAGALPLLLAMAAWALVWEPFLAEHRRYQTTLEDKRETASWMEAAAATIRRHGAAPAAHEATTESLLTLVDRGSKGAGIGGAVKRLEPAGSAGVRLWLEDIPFDRLAAWLVELERTQGVTAESLRLDRQEQDGLVRARLTLVRGGGRQ